MPATIASPPLTARPLRCRSCGTSAPPPDRHLRGVPRAPRPRVRAGTPAAGRETIAGRAPRAWRYKEWLPFEGVPVWSLDTGFTPLVDAPALHGASA